MKGDKKHVYKKIFSKKVPELVAANPGRYPKISTKKSRILKYSTIREKVKKKIERIVKMDFSKEIELIATKKEKTFICVKLFYSKGDEFSWSGNDRRGFYLSIFPIEIDGCWRISTAFSGYKYLIAECKRFSKKIASAAEKKVDSVKHKMISDVCQKNNLELA